MKSEVIKLIEGRDDVTLTTYVLQNSPEIANGQDRPAVIVCPGGAYFSCSDSEAEPVALAFARMGYHAFVLRYSVYGGNGFEMDLSNLPEKKECQNPGPMLDIARAFVYINEHSKEWHVDMSKVGICGFSAGGHNCAMYSTHWSKPVITDAFDVDKEVLRPAVCILGYPLTDYVYMKENASKDPGNLAFFSGSNTGFLGKDWDTPEKLLDASPARLVNDDVPPTFIWSTFGDNLVPVQHSVLYAKALSDAKVPYELHIFERGDHGLTVADKSAASAKSFLNADVAKWVDLCAAWLDKRFVIDIPEHTYWEEMMMKEQQNK